MRYLLLFATALLVTCAPAGSASVTVTGRPVASSAPVSPSVVPSAGPHLYRDIAAVGEFAQLSPDGRTLVSIVGQNTGVPSMVFQSLDGIVLGRWNDPMAARTSTWLPDSSGVFVELAAPQKAGPLGVVSTDGRLIVTGLDDSSTALSPDGKWVAADRQTGCCVSIGMHEISIAPREGGTPRALVVSKDPALQPLLFLGWSATGEVIYRDGATFGRSTIAGRVTEIAAPDSAHTRMPGPGVASPDRRVILTCSADPQQFWIVANGAVTDPPAGLTPAWPLRLPWCSQQSEVHWLQGHELLYRDPSGQLVAFDAVAGARRPVRLPAGATIIAASDDVLLVSIGAELHLIAASTGLDRVVGLGLDRVSAQPIAGGRFFIVAGRAGYLIG